MFRRDLNGIDGEIPKTRPKKRERVSMDVQPGFLREPDDEYELLPEEIRSYIQATCMKHMGDEQKHFIFDPNAKEIAREDETVTFPLKDSPKRVNAYLDDYGSIEALSQEVGFTANTQFKLRLVTDHPN